MSSKKKKKDPAAQQLIDSLLDEQTGSMSLVESQQTAQIRGMKSTDISSQFDDMNSDAKQGFELEKQPNFKQDLVQSMPDEKTVRLDTKMTTPEVKAVTQQPPEVVVAQPKVIDRQEQTDIKTVVKMRDRTASNMNSGANSGGPKVNPSQTGGHGPAFTSSETALKQSENIRIAQTRITELEHELERVRRENEKLATAGETLRRQTDELLSKVESFELQHKEIDRTHSEEKKVYRGQLQAKESENAQMRSRIEEMENRLEGNFKKIRVRERELEHRLEIVRIESQTLIATKDKMILELKRHIDQITLEGDYAKQKSQEMFNQYKDKQETIGRVVRALRIALTILEGDEDGVGAKKTDQN